MTWRVRVDTRNGWRELTLRIRPRSRATPAEPRRHGDGGAAARAVVVDVAIGGGGGGGGAATSPRTTPATLGLLLVWVFRVLNERIFRPLHVCASAIFSRASLHVAFFSPRYFRNSSTSPLRQLPPVSLLKANLLISQSHAASLVPRLPRLGTLLS